jgi:2-methylcitrate dehydratase PrpD
MGTLDKSIIENGGTAKLAAFTAALRYDDLPPTVAHDVKRVILDTLASAIGGHTLEAGRMVQQVAADMGAGRATILGSGVGASAAAAAFANAYLGNVLDADDTVMNAGPPAACAVFPALTLAETEGLSGKALITAVAAGFETAARIGMSLVRSRIDADGKVTRSAQSGLGWYVFGAAVTPSRAR